MSSGDTNYPDQAAVKKIDALAQRPASGAADTQNQPGLKGKVEQLIGKITGSSPDTKESADAMSGDRDSAGKSSGGTNYPDQAAVKSTDAPVQNAANSAEDTQNQSGLKSKVEHYMGKITGSSPDTKESTNAKKGERDSVAMNSGYTNYPDRAAIKTGK